MGPALSIPPETFIFLNTGLYLGVTRNILYVDDDLESRALVAGYLKFRGYEVLTAERAARALGLETDIRLDAIILDVNLIGRDGPVLMALLQEKYPGVPIILYTGMNPEDDKVKGMLTRGARQCVSKNAPLDALVKAVHDVLHGVEHLSSDA
jgi:DNA-binding response OmpR family regulator